MEDSYSPESYVIKVGTSAIYSSKEGRLKKEVMEKIAEGINELKKAGHEIILVSSGAVGCGRPYYLGNEKDIKTKQVQAAIGQPILMGHYREIFSRHNLPIAQFLLSYEDLDSIKKLNNLKNTYNALKNFAVPIVNENDTTAIEELNFGDNDMLAADLAISMDFDKLIILTEKGALVKKPLTKMTYDENNRAQYSSQVNKDAYEEVKLDQNGFGGLESKLMAAKRVADAGKECIIARASDNLIDIVVKKAIVTSFRVI